MVAKKPTAVKKTAPKKSASTGATAPVSHGVGRRKCAVARVWMRRGNGSIVVNGLAHDTYFDTKILAQNASAAFRAVPASVNYTVDVNVHGGGRHGQSDAVKLGIARAFLAFDESIKPDLRKDRLLTVDSRVTERKKYGQRGARRKFQFVKR